MYRAEARPFHGGGEGLLLIFVTRLIQAVPAPGTVALIALGESASKAVGCSFGTLQTSDHCRYVDITFVEVTITRIVGGYTMGGL